MSMPATKVLRPSLTPEDIDRIAEAGKPCKGAEFAGVRRFEGCVHLVYFVSPKRLHPDERERELAYLRGKLDKAPTFRRRIHCRFETVTRRAMERERRAL